jgi:hypothetical protein
MFAETSEAFALKLNEEPQMARLKLATFGIEMDEDQFRGMLVELFHNLYRAIPSVDELLVRPREAIRYCDRVRDHLAGTGEDAAFDLPDEVILRTLLNQRKHG